MAFIRGADAKLYYKVGGQGAGGSWVELTNVKDLKIAEEVATFDVSTRATGGYRAVAPGLKKADVEWEMVLDPDDAGFGAVKDAYDDAAIIGFQVRDSATGAGLQADYFITKFEASQPLDGAQTVGVTAELGYSADAPVRLTAS